MNYTEALTVQTFSIIDALYEYGMNELVISPGSRSTPLAIAAELHEGIRTYIHPDERGAGYFAVGLTKKRRQPVGILCTSGTAAANYTPAVSEAGLSHLPLIVLTSDRPHELKNVGAPQAIEQNNMYSNFIRYQTELPIADSHDSAESLINDKVLQASQYFSGINMGPVHFNIPVREPIMPDADRLDLFKRTQKDMSPALTIPGNIKKLSGTGLVIIGETAEDLSPVKSVLEQGNIITICDPRQNIRTEIKDAIVNHDMMFSNFGNKHYDYIDANVDFIIRIGEPVTSKQTNAFLKRTTVPQYLISEFQDIKPFPVTPDETYAGTINEILPRMISEAPKSDVKDRFITLSKDIHSYIKENIEKFDDEGRYVYDIIQQTDEARTFFLSSSMPIRDFERYDTRVAHDVFANRGANGIDGVISSALGIGTKEQVTMLIGDVSMNHDINSLLMAKLENIDFTVIVFNNNGGNIFSYLPQYAHKQHFERLFGTPLDLNFEHAAKLYDYEYVHIEKAAELTKDMLNKSGRQMIEITTDREHNLESHNELKSQLKNLVDNAEF
ncbi:2-succinyl-5-enolpyruvyl-6-hydroxy-3-cyclohexene-1-carboxylate synthase [Jeotgalicoccus coquinae]|uniref:2-succinyl-5-enolpyruvyl-6-hydroxy-3-cyclohexene-1-carboxylate synthase n=1 Tax=Jeotgalicoccus coquinae TaxID=709509 RepID=A0A6V7RT79_9STAP|nr:2-succinyl-5-enolpyruvyl-6-hydroxy-3-cyclohexene-1-carboxylic-acid synthase [Jeotgalicoccus coquinae]MBB6423254.1 2-succinyl-5-enolpyruvyl-6-hydroxy-3-cyclohexene-1-carboxylate synthase [Jeotgalicoccus coquinae]GGE09461.1 2-succinyl-5-enolpyruvyl-6-hydroxy-3-cyclohexene-1-carboxylate synthase [Jeotgalicoccus coquinae]CAD2081877.1 2-succinyl-5-enolpyruvyl-6-hydroxy-3-cyclohexene-1-carboxylate synthase [Jeotgalicoccus coquinae]